MSWILIKNEVLFSICYYFKETKKRKVYILGLPLFSHMKLKNLAILTTALWTTLSPIKSYSNTLTVPDTSIVKESIDTKANEPRSNDEGPRYTGRDEAIEFKDTEKPNAVVVLPGGYKNNPNFGGGLEEAVNQIKENYDTYIISNENRKNLSEVIDQVQNIEALMIVGARIPSVSSSNNKEAVSYGIISSGGTFGANDVFTRLLKKLHKDATIVLYSCYSGSSGESGYNFINNIKDDIKGRKIIGCRCWLGGCVAKISNIYPLDVSVMRNGKDFSYKP